MVKREPTAQRRYSQSASPGFWVEREVRFITGRSIAVTDYAVLFWTAQFWTMSCGTKCSIKKRGYYVCKLPLFFPYSVEPLRIRF